MTWCGRSSKFFRPVSIARATVTLPAEASTTALSTVMMKGATESADAKALPTSTTASAHHGIAAFSAADRGGAAGPPPPMRRADAMRMRRLLMKRNLLGDTAFRDQTVLQPSSHSFLQRAEL